MSITEDHRRATVAIDPAVGNPAARWPWARRRPVRLDLTRRQLLVTLALLAALVVHVDTQWRAHRTDVEVKAADHRLRAATAAWQRAEDDRATAALAATVTQGRLTVVVDRVETARFQIGQRSAEAGQAQAGIDTTRAELASAKRTFSDTQLRNLATALQLGSLDQCLGGVSRALTQVAFADYGGAAASLAAVAPACDAARASIAASLAATR